MPLADAKLLAIDDDKSRAVGLVALGNLGGCCNDPGLATSFDVFSGTGSVNFGVGCASSALSRVSVFSNDCGCS
jgi:hypothetical protein